MSIPNLHPKCDLALLVTLKQVNAAGALVPLESGAVTVFVATSSASTATAADPTLTGTATYTGAGGKWLCTVDASVLTSTLLASLFAATTPWFIVWAQDANRIAIELAYLDANVVDVA